MTVVDRIATAVFRLSVMALLLIAFNSIADAGFVEPAAVAQLKTVFGMLVLFVYADLFRGIGQEANVQSGRLTTYVGVAGAAIVLYSGYDMGLLTEIAGLVIMLSLYAGLEAWTPVATRAVDSLVKRFEPEAP